MQFFSPLFLFNTFLFFFTSFLPSILAAPASDLTTAQTLSESTIQTYDLLLEELQPKPNDPVDFGLPRYTPLLQALQDGTYTHPSLRNLTSPTTSSLKSAADEYEITLRNFTPRVLTCETSNASPLHDDAMDLINLAWITWRDNQKCDQDNKNWSRCRTLGRLRGAAIGICGSTSSWKLTCEDMTPLYYNIVSCAKGWPKRMGGKHSFAWQMKDGNGWKWKFNELIVF